MLIRDPIHGDIALGPAEAAVLDLPEVQRLRGIKQTGTANLVYPGCVHTRFDHSLGTLAAAHRIAGALAANGHPVSDAELEAIGCAALLHDATHLPYGHTIEDERGLFPRHDAGPRLERLLDGPAGRVLRKLGLFSPVAGILRGTGGDLGPWAAELLAGAVDADLLDYLRRDATFAGLRLDYDDRVYRLFAVMDGHLGLRLAKEGMDRPDARSEVLQLLRMRYFLTERVYFHHAKVAAGAMVAKAVELAVAEGLTEADLLELKDETLLWRLRQWPTRTLVDTPHRALVERVERRDLLKRGYVLSARSVAKRERLRLVERFRRPGAERAAFEADLARELGCPPELVIVWCPELFLMKEAEVLVETVAGRAQLNAPRDHPPLDVRALEEQYEALWRMMVFVPEEHVEACRRACEARFGRPSELVRAAG